MDVVDDSLGASLDAFLARPLFGHLATASPEGPKESPVWYLWEDDRVWIVGDRRTDTFPDRVERDPRCAVGVVDYDRETGLVQHVGLRGRGTIEPFDVDRARRLLRRYLGPAVETWDPRFADLVERPPDTALFVAVDPETVVARDQSYAPSAARRE